MSALASHSDHLKEMHREQKLCNLLNLLIEIHCHWKQLTTEDGNCWFYTNGKNLHYFLEEDNDFKRDIKAKDNIKKQSCLNLGNSERLSLKCVMEENQWMGQYWVQYNNTRAFQNSVDNSRIILEAFKGNYGLRVMKVFRKRNSMTS